MIWFDQEIAVASSPNVTVSLVCYYNPPGDLLKPVIEFCLTSSDGRCKTLLTKNPAMSPIEEPLADEVLAKYHHLVAKCVEKYTGKSFEDLGLPEGDQCQSTK